MGLTEKQWGKVLDDMIYGFEQYEKSDKASIDAQIKAIKLLSKYFSNLWY